MTRLTFSSHPYLLGFEDLDRLVEHAARAGADGYPPYNIEQRGDTAYRVTLAVAGFSAEELSVTVEDDELVVCGAQADATDGRVYLHRGIAARRFRRSFVLASRVQVTGASLENGLLQIDLEVRPAETVRREVRIGGSGKETIDG